MRPCPKPPRSYASDPAVPPFDESRVLLVMDGGCALCSAAARRIARWDEGDRIRIATATSPLGRSLLEHYGLDPDDPATWLMVEEGRASGSLDAVIRIGMRLRWWLAPLALFRLLPGAARDWLYARIARNRYAVFGRGDLCALPDEALRRRLIP